MTNQISNLNPKTKISQEEINKIYEQGKEDYQKIIKSLDRHRFVKKFEG